MIKMTIPVPSCRVPVPAVKQDLSHHHWCAPEPAQRPGENRSIVIAMYTLPYISLNMFKESTEHREQQLCCCEKKKKKKNSAIHKAGSIPYLVHFNKNEIRFSYPHDISSGKAPSKKDKEILDRISK